MVNQASNSTIDNVDHQSSVLPPWEGDGKDVYLHYVHTGDQDAFSAIKEKYYVPMLHIALSYTCEDWHSAEDIVQEAMLRTAMHGSQYNPSQSFKTWLFAITRHAAVDECRRKKRRKIFPCSLSTSSPDDPVGIAGVLDHRDSLAEIDSADSVSFLREKIQAVLGTVPARIAKPTLLRISGLTEQEISNEMRVPLGTVKTRLRFVRLKIAEKLASDMKQSA